MTSSPIANFSPVTATQTRTGTLTAIIIGVTTYFLLNKSGISLSPDGWAFWQGAFSLSEGRGYSYFSGTPIVAWPPLYSIYLSLFISLIGPQAWVIFTADLLLVAIQCMLWSILAVSIIKMDGGAPTLIDQLVIGVFIGLFVSYTQTQVVAQKLTYCFLPLYLLILVNIHKAPQQSLVIRSAVIALLGGCMLLSHNSSIALVASALCLALAVAIFNREASGHEVLRIGIAVLAATAFAVFFWVAFRAYLGQLGSHPPNGGGSGFLKNFLNALQGTTMLLSPHRPLFIVVAYFFTFSLVCAFIMIYGNLKVYATTAAFVLLTFGILASIFSLTFINGSLTAVRFVLFAPLLIMPPLFYHLRARTFVLFVLVLGLTLPLLSYRVINWSFFVDAERVPLKAEISRELEPGETRVIGSRLVIGPIAWEEPLGGYTRQGSPVWGEGQRERMMRSD